MPPLKSPAAFHEQRRSLERARTEDYLKRKIRSRPERSELVRMHILEETSAEPSLQAKQLKLKRARLADDLNDKISHRPGPIELIHKNILPVHTIIGTVSPKGDSSSLDEDSSDALSPDQPANHDSPLGSSQQHSPSDMLNLNGNPSPPQFLPSQGPLQLNGTDLSAPHTLTNGAMAASTPRPVTGHTKSSKSSSERASQRPKKAKDSKPKVKKLKYHQYIPPDQKAEREPPPQMDSSYAKLLQQQQLFLQLQIISQQQQHYNYHTILPAPPKPPSEQQQPPPAPPPPANPGPSPSRAVPTPATTTSSPSTQTGSSRQSQPPSADAKPGTLPANLDEFKVAELKQELKLRGLTVSGTKNDLIERLRNYQEQNGGGAVQKATPVHTQQGVGQSGGPAPMVSQSKEALAKAGSVPLINGHGHAHHVMRFSSTSSSPPVSPAPSDRSLAGMSPDETSCNGDVFGEMVSSPLTQLTLQHSPEHLEPIVKEEPRGLAQLPSCLSRPAPPPQAPSTTAAPPLAMLSPTTTTLVGLDGPLDKDQMLQEKDKQIEELTRMLRQKQRLVETLRSQLEQGKRVGGGAITATVTSTTATDTPNGFTASVPLPQLNGALVAARVKEEVEDEKMATVTTTCSVAMETQPSPTTPAQTVLRRVQMPCSQQTLLKLQQIQRLQAQQQQQEQQQQQQQQQQVQLQRIDLQHQQQQQQKLQQLIIQQKQQQRKQQRPQKQQQQQQKQEPPKPQQVPQVFVAQQPSAQVTAPSISLDLLKAHPAPTLVTDSNGNHYLMVTLANSSTDGQLSVTPQNKTNGRITLQRLQSTPVKLPSQSAVQAVSDNNQSKPKEKTTPVKQPMKKKAGLHLQTNRMQEPNVPVTAPPNLQPFFFDKDSLLDQTSLPLPIKENGSCSQHIDDLFDILIKTGEISSNFKANPDPSLSDLHSNPPTPSPPSSPLRLCPPTPPPEPSSSSSSSSLLSSSSHTGLQELQEGGGSGGRGGGHGRLEDFLESTTGAPLLGGTDDPDGPLTLIDELHSQMLSTPSILEQPPSPMDTCELGFAPHPTGLDFGDPTLDGMDWLDISMGGGGVTGGGGGSGGGGGDGTGGVSGIGIGVNGGSEGTTILAPLGSQTPPSVFSADFLDSSDLQLHWDSCL
ncbi:hypothetical protein ACEWY4_025767 [Coilia grayii]|uniref:SAP domain-containing protein n=1 Tax=Coilia grayii TaxID=363190 RepID=A0ABD1ISV8_9TELE